MIGYTEQYHQYANLHQYAKSKITYYIFIFMKLINIIFDLYMFIQHSI